MKIITAVAFGSLALAGLSMAGTVDNTTLASPGGTQAGCYIGTGCVQTGWTVSTDSTDGTELGLSGILRFVGTLPVSGSTYTSPSGLNQVGSGSSPIDQPNTTAAWDLSFSIDTDPGGALLGDTLSEFTYSLAISDATSADLIGTVSVNPVTGLPDDDFFGLTGVGVNSALTPLVPLVDWGAQNAENLSFFSIPGFDPYAEDDYTITLTETPVTGGPATNSVSIDISVAPEPGTLALLGLGLSGLAFAARKRALKA